MNKLENIGYNQWFQNHIDADKANSHELARVLTVHKDRFIITNGRDEASAELSGNLFYAANSATELPTVGDWVYVDFYDDNARATIHGVLPRKTLLKRKTAGKLVDYQLIAANVDVAFIMQAADFDFNIRRLERYLVMVKESGITPVVLLSKCDLIAPAEIDERVASILNIAPDISVTMFSNLNEDQVEAIKGSLSKGNTYCLIGSSGVGKTTLLNNILGSNEFETQSNSKKHRKGRHTTTSRELKQLDNGAMLIDTPGMRELGSLSIDVGIDEMFADVLDFTLNCKFSNCSHEDDKGCAITVAIETGELSEKRFKNYIKMKNESEHNEMSYAEKRKKDKRFGKLIKSTMKNKIR